MSHLCHVRTPPWRHLTPGCFMAAAHRWLAASVCMFEGALDSTTLHFSLVLSEELVKLQPGRKKTKPDHTRSIKPPGNVQSRRAAFERDRTPLINTSLSRLERVRLTCLCVAGSLCVSGEQGGRAASLFSLSHSFGPSGFIEQLKRSLNPPSEPTRLSREVVPGIPWSWPLPSPPHLYFSVLSNPTQLNVFFNMLLRRWTSCRYRHRAIWMQAGFKTYFRCDIWQRCLENQDKPVQLWDAPTVLNQPLLHEQRSCVRSHTLHGFPERAEDRNVRKWSKILQSLVDWYCFHCYLAPLWVTLRNRSGARWHNAQLSLQIHCLTHNQRRCNPRVKTPVSLTFTMPCKLKSCNPRTELFIQFLRPDEESEPF